MLSTAGLDPVAQEFCGAGMPGCRGSEFSPVSEECPSAMMPRSGPDAEAVPPGGLAVAVLVAVDAGPWPDPQEAAAIRARLTDAVAQTRRTICMTSPQCAKPRSSACPCDQAGRRVQPCQVRGS